MFPASFFCLLIQQIILVDFIIVLLHHRLLHDRSPSPLLDNSILQFLVLFFGLRVISNNSKTENDWVIKRSIRIDFLLSSSSIF